MKNSWQKTMYDLWFAKTTLHSKSFLSKAADEVQFILNQTKLSKGAAILDVPCGTGRHAIQMARKGYHVVAVDISLDCLKLAKKDHQHKLIQYEQGDMINLFPYREKFDLVTNLFSSFGYFSSDLENEKALKEMYHSLRSGGQICLHNINRDWLMTIFVANAWNETPDEFILHQRSYNAKTKYNENRMVVIDKHSHQMKEYYHRIRLYSKDEMVQLLKKVGFRKVKVVGDYQGQKYSKFKSTHPYYFAIKP